MCFRFFLFFIYILERVFKSIYTHSHFIAYQLFIPTLNYQNTYIFVYSYNPCIHRKESARNLMVEHSPTHLTKSPINTCTIFRIMYWRLGKGIWKPVTWVSPAVNQYYSSTHGCVLYTVLQRARELRFAAGSPY